VRDIEISFHATFLIIVFSAVIIKLIRTLVRDIEISFHATFLIIVFSAVIIHVIIQTIKITNRLCTSEGPTITFYTSLLNISYGRQ